MKNLKTRYGYIAIFLTILLIFASFFAIIYGNNNGSNKATVLAKESATTLSSDLHGLNEYTDKTVSLSWDELGRIFEEAELKIENMTDSEADDYLRLKILEYLNTKAELINSGISMLDIYDIYENLTDAEKALMIKYPTSALKVKESKDISEAKTSYYYLDTDNFAKDSADAFRHGCWNALMAVKIGEDKAKLFADAHEERPESFGIDKEMDLSNNNTGRKDGIANSTQSDDHIAAVVMENVSFGHYKKIVDNELVRSDFQNLKGEFAFEYTELADGTLRIDKPLLIANDTYTIPKSIDEKIVTEIAQYAFESSQIKALFFDKYSEIKSIGISAFRHCVDLDFIVFPRSLREINGFAFYNCGEPLVNYNDAQIESIATFAFGNTNLLLPPLFPPTVKFIGFSAFNLGNTYTSVMSDVIIPSTLEKIELGAFAGHNKLTFYSELNSKPSQWSSNWNSSNRPVVWGCNLSSDKKYVVSVNKTSTSIINSNAENGISKPYRLGYNFDGWYTTADFSGTQYMDITAAPNGLLYAKWTDSCVAEGTMITLADGSQKAVEELTGNEMLLVWNLKTGSFDYAPILFIDHDESKIFEVINLSFSDGTNVKIISEHAFWDFDLNQYVFLRNDAFKFIGHWFNKQTNDADGNMIWKKVKLIGVEVAKEYTSAWSPVTANHLCYYVNGMLSMPGATTGLINIFTVNPDTMKIDETAYLADIEMYGLFTYEEFKEIVYISEDMFNAFNGQYLKIAIGKGLITIDKLIELIGRYAL